MFAIFGQEDSQLDDLKFFKMQELYIVLKKFEHQIVDNSNPGRVVSPSGR